MRWSLRDGGGGACVVTKSQFKVSLSMSLSDVQIVFIVDLVGVTNAR